MAWPVEGSSFLPFARGLNSPEAVAWDPERRVLYAGGRHGELYRVTLDGTVVQLVHLGEGSFVLGLALDGQGRVYACERGRGRLLRVDPDSLAVESYSQGTKDRPLVTPNFPVFTSRGELFVSDSGTWGGNDGVIYQVMPGGETRVWSEAISDFTNGLALAPDESALFVAESGQSSVWRVPIEAGGEAGTPERVWSRERMFADGLAFDSLGRLYVSMYRPDCIYRVDIATGGDELVVSDWTAQYLQAPTNLVFAGDGLALLVTANLAGEHLNIFDGDLPATGQPLQRPIVCP